MKVIDPREADILIAHSSGLFAVWVSPEGGLKDLHKICPNADTSLCWLFGDLATIDPVHLQVLFPMLHGSKEELGIIKKMLEAADMTHRTIRAEVPGATLNPGDFEEFEGVVICRHEERLRPLDERPVLLVSAVINGLLDQLIIPTEAEDRVIDADVMLLETTAASEANG